MDIFAKLPELVEWVKKNAWTAFASCVITLLVYGGYQFVGGYANRFGSSFAGEYDSFKHTVASYTVIDVMTQKYMIQYNASRIGVARFHDNVKDVGNNRMFYVTFESMVAQPGVISALVDLKDLPIATFSAILPTLLEGKVMFLWYKDVPESHLKELMRNRGVKAAAFIPISDLNSRLVGMLTVSWMSENDVPSEAERVNMSKVLLEAADKVGAYYSGRSG